MLYEVITLKAIAATATNAHLTAGRYLRDSMARAAGKYQSRITSYNVCYTKLLRLVNSLVIGVTEGFQKELQIVGVGYRAQAKGNKLELNMGYSHPVIMEAPEGITFETPSNTQIFVKGIV